MSRWAIRSLVLGGFLVVGAAAQAHHAVASAYDLNKEIVLQGTLLKLNFVNPHSNLHLAVANADGTTTEWVLTTASIQALTQKGFNKSSIKPGDALKITALPARNGNPAGFIRKVELGDREYKLFNDNGDN
jgi:hypothetical protein